MNLKVAKSEAKYKTVDALSRYKFMMFGYWAAIWVHLNQLDDRKEPNPFKQLVQKARQMQEGFLLMEKQKTGFKFGKYRLTVLAVLGQIEHKGRIYRLVRVKVSSGEEYLSLRLYNAQGKFIKQLLFEDEIHKPLAKLLTDTLNKGK